MSWKKFPHNFFSFSFLYLLFYFLSSFFSNECIFSYSSKLILWVTIPAFVRMLTRMSLSANTLRARQKQHRIMDEFRLTIIDWKTQNNFFLLACLQVHARDNKMEFSEKKNQHLNVSNMDSMSFCHFLKRFFYKFIFSIVSIDENEPLATAE